MADFGLSTRRQRLSLPQRPATCPLHCAVVAQPKKRRASLALALPLAIRVHAAHFTSRGHMMSMLSRTATLPPDVHRILASGRAPSPVGRAAFKAVGALDGARWVRLLPLPPLCSSTQFGGLGLGPQWTEASPDQLAKRQSPRDVARWPQHLRSKLHQMLDVLITYCFTSTLLRTYRQKRPIWTLESKLRQIFSCGLRAASSMPRTAHSQIVAG